MLSCLLIHSLTSGHTTEMFSIAKPWFVLLALTGWKVDWHQKTPIYFSCGHSCWWRYRTRTFLDQSRHPLDAVRAKYRFISRKIFHLLTFRQYFVVIYFVMMTHFQVILLGSNMYDYQICYSFLIHHYSCSLCYVIFCVF